MEDVVFADEKSRNEFVNAVIFQLITDGENGIDFAEYGSLENCYEQLKKLFDLGALRFKFKSHGGYFCYELMVFDDGKYVKFDEVPK